MNKTLVIIGAGGHGRVVGDCAEQLACYENIIFLDDCFPVRKQNAHWPIVGLAEIWPEYINTCDFIIAFGQNHLRYQYYQTLSTAGANLVTLIHPSAIISKHVSIAAGTVVCAGAVINIGSVIGAACIINTAASVDHDVKIADGVHISPNASIAGQVNIAEQAWVGINATVIQCLTIAAHCQIGAGAVVINDTVADSLYVGVPAKLIKTDY